MVLSEFDDRKDKKNGQVAIIKYLLFKEKSKNQQKDLGAPTKSPNDKSPNKKPRNHTICQKATFSVHSNSGAPAPTTGGWTISVRTYIIRTLFVALSVSLVADFFSSSFISDESTGVEEKGLVSDFQMFDLKDGERVPRIRPR